MEIHRNEYSSNSPLKIAATLLKMSHENYFEAIDCSNYTLKSTINPPYPVNHLSNSQGYCTRQRDQVIACSCPLCRFQPCFGKNTYGENVFNFTSANSRDCSNFWWDYGFKFIFMRTDFELTSVQVVKRRISVYLEVELRYIPPY